LDLTRKSFLSILSELNYWSSYIFSIAGHITRESVDEREGLNKVAEGQVNDSAL